MTSARTNRTPKRQAAFLAELAVRGNVTDAALAAGVPRQTVYDWRTGDEAFAAAWDAALDEAADAMEREAWRRAIEGVDEPVFGSLGNNQGSGEIGAVRKYSDTLLIFLMKGANPGKYRDRQQIEHSGPNGTPIQHVFNHASATAGLAPRSIPDREPFGADESDSDGPEMG